MKNLGNASPVIVRCKAGRIKRSRNDSKQIQPKNAYFTMGLATIMFSHYIMFGFNLHVGASDQNHRLYFYFFRIVQNQQVKRLGEIFLGCRKHFRTTNPEQANNIFPLIALNKTNFHGCLYSH